MPHRTSSPIRLPSASPLLEKVLLFALACCTLSRSWAQDSAFGCYNLPGAERTCTCTDEMCEESACVAAGGLYVAGCATCQCDEGTFEQEGYGCYSIEVNQCDCFPEVCSNETCVMSGGLWTDGTSVLCFLDAAPNCAFGVHIVSSFCLHHLPIRQAARAVSAVALKTTVVVWSNPPPQKDTVVTTPQSIHVRACQRSARRHLVKPRVILWCGPTAA